MSKQSSTKKCLFAVLVFAVLFISDLAVAYDHHDLDHPPLRPCPICASSRVLSFADNSPPISDFIATPVFTAFLLPFERYISYHTAFRSILNYRAPPPDSRPSNKPA
ncbi:MAG TPA: hypothetical protein VFG19_02600 [Geobacteraceae bacterium]|nr:hypothetical protein [Geobacteraceae bacterium]